QAREALSEITGQPTAPNLAALQNDFPLPAPSPDKVEDWVAAAREDNLAIVASRLSADIARKGVSIARAGHLPTVGAQAQYNDGSNAGSRCSGESESETIGVQVTLPLFAGGATHSGVRQAIATREQRIAELDGQCRLVERNTRDAYQG